MNITESQLRAIMPKASAENIQQFVVYFNKYSDDFGITTPLRAAHFISQVAHESGELRYTEENLNYSADALRRVFPKYFNRANVAAYARNPERIANRVYGGRMGNGAEETGDGWRFRGRGLIQLTGKNNYSAYANSGLCNGDLMSHPEWLKNYPGALKSAMFFWKSNGLNALADKDDVVAVTKRINGGTIGLEDRKRYTLKAKAVLCV